MTASPKHRSGGRITVTIRTPLSLAIILSIFAFNARADILYVDADATGADDGSSWTDAFLDLQSALDVAAAGDEVWVAEGTYLPSAPSGDLNPPVPSRAVSFELVAGVALYGGFQGTEQLREQRDWEANETVLSCDLDQDDILGDPVDPTTFRDDPSRDDNCYHVVIARSGGPDTIVDGFTVTSGQSDLNGITNVVSPCCGGGLFVESAASPQIRNCEFIYNLGQSEGGGIVHRGAITVLDSEFIANYSTDGGGIFSGSLISGSGSLVFPSASGGLVRGCAFRDNVAGAEGGGFFTINSNNVYENCTVTHNVSEASGGGATLSGGNTVIRNCLIADNEAIHNGGGIACCTGSLNPVAHELVNVTIADNTANNGGGLVVGDAATTPSFSVANSILWDNSAANDGDEVWMSVGVDFDHSLVRDGILVGSPPAPGPRFHVVSGTPTSTNEVTGDPDLTASHQLGPSSVAIGAGDPNRSYAGQTDVDGEPRVMGPCTPAPDLGSDEFFYPSCWNSVSNCSGDVDVDGVVSPIDLDLWLGSGWFNTTTDSENACGDFNRDGILNVGDLSILTTGITTAPASCTCGDPWPPGS